MENTHNSTDNMNNTNNENNTNNTNNIRFSIIGPSRQIQPWDKTFMTMCNILAHNKSTCCRIQTAALIIKENRIISIGYNGVPANQIHCQDYWKDYFIENYKFYNNLQFDEFIKTKDFYDLHHSWSNINEIHGEMNAILFAAKYGINLDGSTLYTSFSPCINCAKAILTTGIKKVIYSKVYKRSTDGLDFLKKNNIIINEVNIGDTLNIKFS